MRKWSRTKTAFSSMCRGQSTRLPFGFATVGNVVIWVLVIKANELPANLRADKFPEDYIAFGNAKTRPRRRPLQLWASWCFNFVGEWLHDINSLVLRGVESLHYQ